MAIFKCTMIFQLTTNLTGASSAGRRLAGWSESWYFTGTFEQARDAMLGGAGLCHMRAAMLTDGAAIVGQRVAQVDPAGASQEFAKKFPGGLPISSDIPQMTMLTRVQGTGVPNEKALLLRGMPDSAVQEGEYNAATAYDPALRAFLGYLKAIWQFRALKATNAVHKIHGIVNALVTTEDAHGYLAGDIVNIRRTLSTSRTRAIHGRQVVIAPVTALTFTVAPETDFANSIGGNVTKWEIIYPFSDGNTVDIQTQVTTRKVGRPSAEYRGRR